MNFKRLTLDAMVLALAAGLSSCIPKQPPVSYPPPTPVPTSTPRPLPTPTPPVQIPPPTPSPRPSPVPVPTPVRAKPRVALFSGHVANPSTTYDRQGSLSASGTLEYAFNDGVVERFGSLPSPAATYFVFPATDNVPLRERPRRAQAVGAEIYIELHHDSAQPQDIERLKRGGKTPSDWQELSGFSVFYSRQPGNVEKNQRLATLIAEELRQRGFRPNLYHAKPIPGESRELLDPELGLYEGSHLYVLRESGLPAVLVECGVAVNPFEEAWLKKSGTQQRIVEAIDAAVAKYALTSTRSPTQLR